MITGLACLLALFTVSVCFDDPVFRNVELEDPFKEYLLSNPILMESTGAKVICLEDGSRMLLAVGSTVVKDESAKERLRMLRVCQSKALATFVGELKGVEVYHLEKLSEKTTVVRDGTETANSVAEYTNLTKAQIHGISKDMPVVGQWFSEDKSVFYLAIGMIVDAKGERVVGKSKK